MAVTVALEMVLTDDRSAVHRKIDALPEGSRVTFKRPKRSLTQNAMMWAKLGDISEQVIWYGERLTDVDWKDVLTASLRKSRVVPTIDGDGLVPLGLHTSEMEEGEMWTLIDLIDAFGAEQGVRFKAPRWLEERAAAQRTAKAKP